MTSTAADGTVTSNAYNPAHELLGTNQGGVLTTFAYDAAGNTVREVGPSADVTYTWDGENRLTQVNAAGSMETYTYDASGLRRKKTAGGSTTNFVWDRANLLAELDGSLARTAHYTDFPGVWGGLASQRRDGTSRHFVHDLSANTRALLDGGTVTDSYLYRAFGVEEAVSGSTANVMRFGGQVGYYRDLADRLYVRARWYRPQPARWLSADPLGSECHADQPYSYLQASPLRRLDPSGSQPYEPDWVKPYQDALRPDDWMPPPELGGDWSFWDSAFADWAACVGWCIKYTHPFRKFQQFANCLALIGTVVPTSWAGLPAAGGPTTGLLSLLQFWMRRRGMRVPMCPVKILGTRGLLRILGRILAPIFAIEGAIDVWVDARCIAECSGFSDAHGPSGPIVIEGYGRWLR